MDIILRICLGTASVSRLPLGVPGPSREREVVFRSGMEGSPSPSSASWVGCETAASTDVSGPGSDGYDSFEGRLVAAVVGFVLLLWLSDLDWESEGLRNPSVAASGAFKRLPKEEKGFEMLRTRSRYWKRRVQEHEGCVDCR